MPPAGSIPAAGGWQPANLRWLLARLGPVGTASSPTQLGINGCARSAAAAASTTRRRACSRTSTS